MAKLTSAEKKQRAEIKALKAQNKRIVRGLDKMAKDANAWGKRQHKHVKY